MNQIIEVNIVDVLFRLESKIDKLTETTNEIKIDIEKLKTQNKQINKRLDNIETRLNTMTLGFLGIVEVLVTGLLAIIGKITFFPNV